MGVWNVSVQGTHLAGTLRFWLGDSPAVAIHDRLFGPGLNGGGERPLGSEDSSMHGRE